MEVAVAQTGERRKSGGNCLTWSPLDSFMRSEGGMGQVDRLCPAADEVKEAESEVGVSVGCGGWLGLLKVWRSWSSSPAVRSGLIRKRKALLIGWSPASAEAYH